MASNVYKTFVLQAWNLQTKATGLLHPHSLFDDPRGQSLRRELYRRLRYHFRFSNQFMLFPEIGHRVLYSINVYGPKRAEPRFVSMFNLFHASTVAQAFAHDGGGPVPGIKDDENHWVVAGHKRRLVQTTSEELRMYAELYDPGTDPAGAKLPAVHSEDAAEVLRMLSEGPRRLQDFGDDFHYSAMWHESGAQKQGIIRRHTAFPNAGAPWILSGPHFFIGNPYFKTPNEGCKTKGDYSRMDLTVLPEDYCIFHGKKPLVPRYGDHRFHG